mgnify:FL=1|jgi:TRAP-type C4-dicarboxylate transport system permease small subunit
MFATINKLFGAFQKVLLCTITLALIVMMVVILLQVFTRYVIFYSLPWSEELSRYLFVFIILIGINIAVSQEILIKIDALQNMFQSLRARIVFDIFHTIIGIIACILIASYATDLFPVGMVQKSPAMRIPMIIMYGIVFGGYVLSTIALGLKLIEKILAFCDPKNKGVRISFEQDVQEAMKGE